jgi:hypothetical protein
MRRIFLLITVVVVLVWVGIASAAHPHLKGQYAFTGESACLISPNGFEADLTPIGGVHSSLFSVQGVRTFNGDGTGSVQGNAVEISPPPALHTGAGSHTFSYKFTYTIDKEGVIISQMVPGSFTGTYLTGPRATQTFTIDEFSLSGMVSHDHKVLTLTTKTTEIETHTFSNGDILPAICHRSRILIRLGD